jgi:hypothetical protein
MKNSMQGRRAISCTTLTLVPLRGGPGHLGGQSDRGRRVEDPVVPLGGFTSVLSGSSFGTRNPWTVIGPAGTSVSPISGAYAFGVFTFPAQSGNQCLDLTGDVVNSTEGVRQTVATSVGANYELSFYVGNVFNPGGPWGTISTADVSIHGGPAVAYTNSMNGGTSQVWQQFVVDFTATSASTMISFVNSDPRLDNTNGLDNASPMLDDDRGAGAGDAVTTRTRPCRSRLHEAAQGELSVPYLESITDWCRSAFTLPSSTLETGVTPSAFPT